MTEIIRGTDVTEPHAARPFQMAGLEMEALSIVQAAKAKAREILQQAVQKIQGHRDQARAEAHAAGREAGFAQGLEEGRQKGRAEAEAKVEEAARTLATALEGMAGDLEAHRRRLLEEGRRNLLHLALAIAESVVAKQVKIDATAVTAQVERAVALAAQKTDIEVRLHPDDRAAVEAFLPALERRFAGGQAILVTVDAAVARGGCLVKTPSGDVDAQIGTILSEVRRLLLGS